MTVLKRVLNFIIGTSEGTIREPFIDPKVAIRKNKDTIKKMIDQVSSKSSTKNLKPSD